MTSVLLNAMHIGLKDDIIIPKEYARHLRRADELTRMAVACTHYALEAAGLREQALLERTGLFLGTSFGPLETNFRFLDTLLDDGEGQASPTLFSHSVHNAAAGYISRIFKIVGPTFTINSYCWPFLTALWQAIATMEAGLIDRAVVTSVELYSPVLGFAGKQLTDNRFLPHQSGAVCWIIDRQNGSNADGKISIKEIGIKESADVALFLTRAGEEFSFAGKTVSTAGVFSYVCSLFEYVENISKIGISDGHWSVKAPFGRANVRIASN